MSHATSRRRRHSARTGSSLRRGITTVVASVVLLVLGAQALPAAAAVTAGGTRAHDAAILRHTVRRVHRGSSSLGHRRARRTSVRLVTPRPAARPSPSRGPAARRLAATEQHELSARLAGRALARPARTATDPLAGEGGTVECTEANVVQLDVAMAYGTSGTVDVDGDNSALGADSVCTLTGVVPAGWNVFFGPYSVNAAPNPDGTAGVEGTLTLGSWYDGFNNSCYGANFNAAAGMTFYNEGTITQSSFNGAPYNQPNCGFPDPTVNLANFVQEPGATFGIPAGSSWDFDYDNSTTPGTFLNEGSLSVPSTGTLQLANGNCTKGIDFVSEPGSTVAVASGGTFAVECGLIDVEGGTISSGVVTTGDTHIGLIFGASIPSTSAGAIQIPGGAVTLTGTVAPGWTVVTLNGGTITAAPGSGNDGVIQFTSTAVSDTGAFTNAGTLDASGGGTLNVADLVNTGLLEMTAYNASSADALTLNYDSTSGPAVLDNTGTIHVDENQTLYVGPQNCHNGTDLVMQGGTIDAPGTFALQCGELDLDGGTISSAGPAQVFTIGQTMVDFDTGLGTGSVPGTDVVAFHDSGGVAEGLIPSGWTVSIVGNPISVAAGTVNDGSLDFADYGAGLTDTGTFTNNGTMTVASGDGATINTPDLENTGTIDLDGANTGSSNLNFNYDSAGGAGLIDNSGTIAANGGQLTVGKQSCQHGEDLVDTSGSSLAATTGTGTFFMQCGELDLNGGQVTTGAIQVEPVGTVLVDFDAGLAAGTAGSDTVELEANGYTVEGAVPAGWTLNDDGHPFTADSGMSNAGTVEFTAYDGGITDAGSFTNTGTMTVATGEGATINVESFTNAGTIDELGTSTGSTSLSFTYDSSGGPGTIANSGTIEAQGGQLTVGSQSCQHGEDLVDTAGASLAATASTAAFDMQCGELDLDGGSIASGGPVQVDPDGAVLVDFDTGLANGAGGTADTVELEANGYTVEGAVPAGWTLNDDGHPFTADSGMSNAGTVEFTAYDGGITDAGSFTNTGTMTVASGEGATINVESFTNAGTIDELGTSTGSTSLSFTYDSSGGPGTIANSGTIEAQGGQLTVGSQSCQHGEDLVDTAGASLAATASTAAFDMQCGELDLDGGSIASGGPVQVDPDGAVLVDFDTGLANGTGGTADTVELEGPTTSIVGTIPAGWTLVDNGQRATVNSAMTNDGTIELAAYGSGFNGSPGTFTNNGSIQASNSATMFSATATALDNAGTITIGQNDTLVGSSTSLDNTGTISLAQNAQLEPQLGYTQGAAGTLGVTVVGGNAAEVSSSAGSASIAGTLAITTGTLPSEGSTLTVVQSSGPLSGTFSSVTGRYPGSVGYLPAYTSTAAKLDVLFTQGIAFSSTAPVDAVFAGPTYPVSATGGGSGNPVTFSIAAASASVCAVTSGVVSFVGTGSCEVDANQSGSSSYLAAAQVSQTFTVSRATQTLAITSTAPGGATVGGPGYTVTTTAGASGNPVTLSIPASSASVCRLTGSVVGFTGVGTCEVDANEAGNSDYLAAAMQDQTFPVGQGSQTISFTSVAPTAAVVGGTNYVVMTTGGGSGNPVTLSIPSSSSSVCSLSGSSVSFTGVGSCVVDANQAGNTDYLAASEQEQSFTVAKGASAITVSTKAPTGAVIGGGYAPKATSSSGDAVVITLDAASSGCTLSSGAVHFTASGTCVVDFNDPGNSDYLAAPVVRQSIVIAKRSLTLKVAASPTAAKSSKSIRLTATLSVKTTGTVTFTAKGKTLCSAKVSAGVASCKVTVALAKGTYTVTASFGGNATYRTASATTKLTVS